MDAGALRCGKSTTFEAYLTDFSCRHKILRRYLQKSKRGVFLSQITGSTDLTDIIKTHFRSRL